MKNLIILSVLFLSISITTCAQKKAPEAVTKAFTQKFAAAKSVKWDNESANEWEAEFMMNGKEMSSSFDVDGKWLETETEISSKELPSEVTATLAKEFSGYKTGEMSIIENPEMKGFEIALKKDKSAIEVVIDANGKVLKNTSAGKKEDKD
jgi:adenylyl- and sulfurtransferase ThiI